MVFQWQRNEWNLFTLSVLLLIEFLSHFMTMAMYEKFFSKDLYLLVKKTKSWLCIFVCLCVCVCKEELFPKNKNEIKRDYENLQWILLYRAHNVLMMMVGKINVRVVVGAFVASTCRAFSFPPTLPFIPTISRFLWTDWD